MTLAQVKAARPTMDFDGRYGSTTGPWTTEMFVEAVYSSLSRPRSGGREELMRTLLLVTGVALIVGTAAYAHHSYAATYDVTKEVKLEGKLVQFVLRNPHSFVHMEAPDEHGMTQRWAVEWAGTAQLGAQGVKRESLKVGDAITVTARPSRVPGGAGRSCSACGVRSTGSPGVRARVKLLIMAEGRPYGPAGHCAARSDRLQPALFSSPSLFVIG